VEAIAHGTPKRQLYVATFSFNIAECGVSRDEYVVFLMKMKKNRLAHHATLVFIKKVGAGGNLCLRALKGLICNNSSNQIMQ